MSHQPVHIYEFGPYRLDAAERLLLRDGAVVPLQPKVFDLLLVLVEQHGHLLEKEELLQRVWPDTVVEEANLANNISILRKTLGENGQPFIETAPKHGYRFVAPVSEVMEERETMATGAQAVSINDWPELTTSPLASAHRTSWRWLAVALGVLLAAVGILYAWRSRVPSTTTHSLAVLPFKPLVAENRDEALQLGLADTLIFKLSGLQQLLVRPTSAVRKYTDPEQDPLAAGREQQTDLVLDASFQRDGERIRVRARLLQVANGKTLWTYECEERYCASLFAIEDALSNKVVNELALHLTGAEQARLNRHGTENREAYLLYLQGRVYWNKRTDQALRHAVTCFQQAIALDQNYALAYSGLADACAVLAWLNVSPPQEFAALARTSARKAVELDDGLAETWASRGRVSHSFDWDLPKAEREFQRALALNPHYAVAHQWHADNLVVMGRGAEALAEIKLAQQLDPDSLPIARDVGRLHWFARQYEQAIAAFHKSFELDNNFLGTHQYLGMTYATQGRPQEAIAELNQAYTLSGGQTELLAARGYAYALAGRQRELQETLVKLQEQARQRYVPPYEIATIYAALGDREQAFAWLEKACAERNTWLLHLKVDPRLESLHGDARLSDILRRLNLAP